MTEGTRQKAEGRRQKAQCRNCSGKYAFLPSAFCLVPSALCLVPSVGFLSNLQNRDVSVARLVVTWPCWGSSPGAVPRRHVCPRRRGRSRGVDGRQPRSVCRRRWDEALTPTRALVERFPSQQVYSDRLARIYSALGTGRGGRGMGAVRQDLVDAGRRLPRHRPRLSARRRSPGLGAGLRALQGLRPHERRALVVPRPGLSARAPSEEALNAFREAVRIDPFHATVASGWPARCCRRRPAPGAGRNRADHGARARQSRRAPDAGAGNAAAGPARGRAGGPRARGGPVRNLRRCACRARRPGLRRRPVRGRAGPVHPRPRTGSGPAPGAAGVARSLDGLAR